MFYTSPLRKVVIKRYQITSSFHLGAQLKPLIALETDNASQDSTKRFKAHAWITVNEQTIIGGPQDKDYNVVASFVSVLETT